MHTVKRTKNNILMHQNTTPLLTVGLPFYNNEDTLADAIKSVLLQTYQDWQLIMVDDGSTDNSLQIAQKFAAIDNRITLITDGENKGLVSRLNQIIELSESEYIARMDGDDMMLPSRLEKQMSVLIANKQIDIIDSAAYIIDENNKPTGFRKLLDLSNWNHKKVLTKRLLFHPTVIAKKSWYVKNRYDENFVRSEDFELWCRSFDGTVFHRIHEPLFLYREGNVSISNYTKSGKSHRKALKKHRQGVLSRSEYVSEIVKSHLKSALYRLFGFFNKQYILAERRNVKLNAEQAEEVNALIKKIKEWK